MAELHLSRARIRLDHNTIAEIAGALEATTGEWSCQEGGRYERMFADSVILPFLNNARIPIPIDFIPGLDATRVGERARFRANLNFIVAAPRYVRLLYADRLALLDEVDEWKRRAEDYRDMLIQQGRKTDG